MRVWLNRGFLILVALLFAGLIAWGALNSTRQQGPFILAMIVAGAAFIAIGLGVVAWGQRRVQSAALDRMLPAVFRFSIANDPNTQLGIDGVAGALRLKEVGIGRYDALAVVANAESIRIFKGAFRPRVACEFPASAVARITTHVDETFVGRRTSVAVSFRKIAADNQLLLTPVSNRLGYPLLSKPDVVSTMAMRLDQLIEPSPV